MIAHLSLAYHLTLWQLFAKTRERTYELGYKLFKLDPNSCKKKKTFSNCPQCGHFPDLFLLILRKDKVMRYLGAARRQRQPLLPVISCRPESQ